MELVNKAEVLAEVLSNRIDKYCASLIVAFCGDRCTLCDDRVAVVVKDGDAHWQLWCVKCVIDTLPDETHFNI